MSTKFTKKRPPMTDSHSLQLLMNAAQVNQTIGQYLSIQLQKKGFKSVSPPALNFLSALDCGINYASDIARRLGVSRQMVAKTVRELSAAGYLEQVDDVGKQKKILFTQTGEALISEARQLLAEFDELLLKQLGQSSVNTTIDHLKTLNNIVEALK